MPQRERQRFAPRQAAELAADEGAAELADAGDERSGRASAAADLGSLQDGEIGAQAGDAEEHRHEQGRDQAAQLLVDMAGEDRRFADQDAGDEGAEHGVHADQMR